MSIPVLGGWFRFIMCIASWLALIPRFNLAFSCSTRFILGLILSTPFTQSISTFCYCFYPTVLIKGSTYYTFMVMSSSACHIYRKIYITIIVCWSFYWCPGVYQFPDPPRHAVRPSGPEYQYDPDGLGRDVSRVKGRYVVSLKWKCERRLFSVMLVWMQALCTV